MNKLEEYKKDSWETFIKSEESFGIEHDEAYEKGFDAAIALDLPVKFLEWSRENCDLVWVEGIKEDLWEYEDVPYTEKELYQYWIDKIYKP